MRPALPPTSGRTLALATGLAPVRQSLGRATAHVLSLVLLGAGLSFAATTLPAAAAEPTFSCAGGSVYLVRSDGEIDRVAAPSGVLSGGPLVAGTPDALEAAGALGVASSGRAVAVVGAELVEHGPGATGEPVAGPVARPVGGAVDPVSGMFYEGSFKGSTLVLRGYDLAKHAVARSSVRVRLPKAPGHDGDFAFDGAGHVYVVASSAKKAAFYVASVPGSGSGSVTAARVRTSTVAGAVTGLAFASDGFLYASTAHALRRLDPVTGVLGAARDLAGTEAVTDLGSCAVPSVLSLRTNLPDGRVRTHDQFRSTIRSAALDGLPRALRPVGTTSGTEKGVQDQRASELAGPAAVLPGQTYAIATRGLGQADDERYVGSYRCTDAQEHVVAQGDRATGSVTVPSGVSGAVVVCTVTEAAPAPSLAVTQTLSPARIDHAGGTATFTAVVTNTGNVALGGLELADSRPGLPARTCTPTALGGTLAVAASTTCTTTTTVTQADLDATRPTSDRVSVTASTPRRLGAVSVTAAAQTALTVAAAPALSVTTAVDPAAVARVGQRLTSTVTVRNSGNQTLRDVVATAAAPDLAALSCAPVAQGGTLAVGGSTVCTGSRTSDQSDLRAGGRTVSASVAGLGPAGTGVTATSAARTGVASTPPSAADDAVTVPYGTAVVTLATSPNDGPGEPGGPALDLSRTVLLQQGSDESKPGRRTVYGSHGNWSVLPDGSVRYLALTQPWQLGPVSGYTEVIRYRTFDVAGQSAVARLRITFQAGAVARPDVVTGVQGDPLVARPLPNDSPGRNLDGSRAVFDQGSLHLTEDQPEGTAVVSLTGDTLSIPFTGTFAVADGTITFAPAPQFARTVAVAYAVTDSAGDTARSTVTFTVTPVVPVVTDDSATTVYGATVALAGTRNDAAGVAGRQVGFDGFVGRDGALAGTTLVTAQGRWLGPPVGATGTVAFEPAAGFSGVATARYEARTERGGTAIGSLQVTVRPGPSARPAVLRTTREVTVTVDPTRYATPSQHADGSAGAFEVGRTTFDASGQPAGASLGSNGTSLMLPGGTARIAAGTGLVTFSPDPGFTGYVGRISVGLAIDVDGFPSTAGSHVSVPLTVLVTGTGPVATDDRATTVLDQPVTLAGATDDDPGTATTTPLTITFPSTGQPAGSVVSGGGKKLTDPEEGVWTIAPAGTVAFTPAAGFVDSTSPVVYRVEGAGGRTDTADLQVTVTPGASAVRDVLVRPQSSYYLQVDPLANDLPGRDADGTLGTIDETTVRFPSDGQPAGATTFDDGRSLDVPLPGTSDRVRFQADPSTGVVLVYQLDGFRGALPTVRYAVQSRTTGSTGVVQRHTVSAALQVRLVGRDPIATDDHVTVAADQDAVVPGPSNDIPPSADVGIDTTGGTFPVDQVADLPKGSKVDVYGGQNEGWWEATVPGEGYWRLYWSDPFVTFDPEPGFRGTTTPLRYEIRDSAGSYADALLTVTVLPPAVRRDDAASTRQGTPVRVDVLANDTPAAAADGSLTADPVGAYFSATAPGQPKGAVVVDGDLVVPKEGTYRPEPGSGRVTFSPEPTFHGTTSPVTVSIGNQQSRLRVGVSAVVPTAGPDDATTTGGAPVRVAVLDDDAPGTASLPLVGSTLRLRTTSELPAGSSLSTDGQVLGVAGRGVFAVAGDGTLTFYPLGGVVGTLPPVGYEVADVNGTRARSTVTVRVAR